MKTRYIESFDIARKAYPGIKRGLKTEFDDFRKKHKDWKKALPLLSPAIDEQIRRREINAEKGDFVPPWKHFKTWLYNRCWEETEGVTESPEEKAVKEKQTKNQELLKYRQKIKDRHQEYLESKRTEALLDIKKDDGHLYKMCGWLIDEILNERNRQMSALKGSK